MGEVFPLVAIERRRLADTLEGLSDVQWTAPSLCSGWRVREVAAHLVWPTETPLPKILLQLALAGFDFAKVADRAAKADDRSGADLIAALRRNADSRFKPPGMGPEAPLTDVVVHGLDIRMPLDLDTTVSEVAAPIVLGFLLSPAATKGFIAKGRTAGLRFETTDLDWSAGTGPTVRGTTEHLILALAGRPSGLDHLGGDGADEFRSRVDG